LISILSLTAQIPVNSVAFFLTPIYLAAFRSIEKDPDREIITEVFKAMFDARGREQGIVGRESLACSGANELAAALRHDVDLITRMRGLRVVAARRVQLHNQRTMLEQAH
jgi:hypothetical protein